MSRRTAAARFGLTIRDSSSCHLNGRRNPADARPTLRDEAVRLHRCKMRAAATTWRRRARAFRALRVSGAHQAGCDPFARKRPEKLTKAHNYRLNIPALGLRRVVSSGFLSPPLPLAADDKTHQQQPLKCHHDRTRSCLAASAAVQHRPSDTPCACDPRCGHLGHWQGAAWHLPLSFPHLSWRGCNRVVGPPGVCLGAV